ncbi:GABA permease [Klebsiella quasipneumoniae]|uniref:GABA permease n=1 Tax=Klebsiella quasipneumoniae TaxID=1463165 RepID=UPI000808C28F|nr:GABA permease [Klebsiella quasipneumoniae]SCA13077.1 gamma-aminobutyrate transporter [Klebsiella quasipneumoniae]
MGQLSQSQDLGAGLKSRHVTMLSIAGVIGASLFVGSSVAIAEAGPAVLLAYLFAGLLVVMIMRMLAEMAVATPDTGSFSTYADKAIGRWAGYTIGWLYWWFWVLVIPLEANIAAIILHSWVPGVPVWLFSLVITLALTGSNLLSVKNYGEFEFWLALCKVVAILAFIILGAVAITGFYPYAEVSGISRLWDHGGFMPNGFGAVLSAMLSAMLITMFSFMGAEIVTIAAAESDTPDKHIVRATNSVIWRISIFYLCSIFIVVALIPWNMPGLKSIGSYRSVLELLHIPYAKLIMDGVILLSVTSCLNSALYTASRMLYSLSRRGDAPAFMGRTNRSKTPYVAVLLSTGAAFLTVVVNYYAPAKVFKFLIDSSGAIALLVYLVIAVSQLRMRKILQAQGGEIRLRMWLYPYLTWLVIAFITFVLVVMLFRPAQQLEVISTGLLALGIICTVPIMSRWKKLVLWQKLPLQNTR